MSDESKHAERQATGDLLAGFDRPGRSPRAPAVRVELPAAAPYLSGETVLVTRKRGAALWPWLIAAFVASVGLGLIFFVAILRGRTESEAPPIASVAATADPVVPSAAPVVPAVSVAAPIVSATHARRPAPGPAPKKPEHRGDFVQDL